MKVAILAMLQRWTNTLAREADVLTTKRSEERLRDDGKPCS